MSIIIYRKENITWLFLKENVFYDIVTVVNKEEKSLCYVAMVAKFLDDNKPIKSLKSLFALIQTLAILFNFI